MSAAVNFTILEEPPKKVVVWLDPDEFHSTWLGNKAVYRTRMAVADGGELHTRPRASPHSAKTPKSTA